MANADDDRLDERLKSLEDKLSAKTKKAEADNNQKSDSSGWGNALKMSSEFVAAVLVGAGLGWFFDQIVGTAPWGMIFFLLLGFAAGVLNVMRAAGTLAERKKP